MSEQQTGEEGKRRQWLPVRGGRWVYAQRQGNQWFDPAAQVDRQADGSWTWHARVSMHPHAMQGNEPSGELAAQAANEALRKRGEPPLSEMEAPL